MSICVLVSSDPPNIVTCVADIFSMTGAYSTIVYFVPLYFQSVRGVSPEQSGIRTLALVIALGKFIKAREPLFFYSRQLTTSSPVPHDFRWCNQEVRLF